MKYSEKVLLKRFIDKKILILANTDKKQWMSCCWAARHWKAVVVVAIYCIFGSMWLGFRRFPTGPNRWNSSHEFCHRAPGIEQHSFRLRSNVVDLVAPGLFFFTATAIKSDAKPSPAPNAYKRCLAAGTVAGAYKRCFVAPPPDGISWLSMAEI